ncbi:MAG: ABC transporter permease [Bacteroidia bacterium]
MKSPVLIIARKELQVFFDSLVAYILLIAFLGFSGFFTWVYFRDVFFTKQASLVSFFGTAYWTLFFFIPALTMKMLAEESKSGTIELLLTKPVTNWEVLWGKFLACFSLIVVALLFTLPYVITIINLGNVDKGVIMCGYLALLFMSAAYISIGLFASSITNNQIVALLFSLFIGVFLHVLLSVFASALNGGIGEFLNYLSLESHYDSISRGVIDSRDIVYFLSIVFIGMVMAESSLAKRSISE